MRNCYHLVPYSRLAILLWTLLIVVLCNCSPSFGCPLEEYETLLNLKSSILHNNKTSPHTWGKGRDCCLWERVTCTNNTQQVSKLNLSSLLELAYGQLNFNIFSSFHELRLLNLSNNAIRGLQSQTGTWYLTDISGLRKLEILDLSYNGLTGTIPLFFKNLSSLSVLNLQVNWLSDALDVEGISGLRKLEILDLSFNYFIKTVPLSFKNLSSLHELYLIDNQLHSPLHLEDISRLTKLEILDLSYNMLIEIPLSLKNLSSLSILNLRENMLNCTLNVEGLLAGLQKLRVLDLGLNYQLTGGIPMALGNLSSLNLLYLDSNNLTGSVPSYVLSRLQNLHELDLSHNQLDGSLPSSLENPISLKHLDLSYNKMKGNIPSHIFAGLVSLRYLDLSYNLFDGHFSFSSFGNLSKLEYIDLSNNEELFIHLESGEFVPPFQLQHLMLSHCNLDVNTLATPALLASRHKLKLLDLSDNNLRGHFPNWLFENLTRLEFLNLRNNSIIGEIQFPKHLNTSVYKVDLSMNFLSGSIPVDIGTIFPRMVALNLSSNNLIGTIPSSLGPG